MRVASRWAGAGLVLALAASVVVAAAGDQPARAQESTPSPHWGTSPYFPNCLEGPCRVVFLADKTGNAQFGAQIDRWARWMNFVRVNHNLSLPAFAYVALNDSSCAVAPGVVSLCRNDQLLAADCPEQPAAIRCSTFTLGVGDGHLGYVRTVFAEDPVDNADAWNLVCAALGRAIGMPTSADPASCLRTDLTLGTGVERYYTAPDWLDLFINYAHPAGS